MEGRLREPELKRVCLVAVSREFQIPRDPSLLVVTLQEPHLRVRCRLNVAFTGLSHSS